MKIKPDGIRRFLEKNGVLTGWKIRDAPYLSNKTNGTDVCFVVSNSLKRKKIMLRILLLFLGIFCVSFPLVEAQDRAALPEAASLERLEQAEDTLGALAFIMLNDSLPEHRFGACRRFIPLLTSSLREESSFSYPFSQLVNISIMYPPDSSFRIFSWHLYVDEDTYHYYGAIQMNKPELELFPLLDRSREIDAVERRSLKPDEWYGVVYYNIKAFDTPEGTRYLLFGFDGYQFFEKRKVVDVLSFVDGKPVFGAAVFAEMREGKAENIRHRLLLQYSADASVRLNYDELLEMITHDHLIEAGGMYPGQGPVMVPDGSYVGYRLEDGLWVYVEKLFDQVQEEAPREYPVLNGREGKDLFGKEKN
jgi:hypothetical protein